MTNDPHTHDAWSRRMADHLMGRSTPDDARELEAHAARCDECRHELGDLRAIADVLRADPTRDDLDLAGGWSRLAAALPTTARGPTHFGARRRRRWIIAAGVTAGLGTALAATLLLMLRTTHSDPRREPRAVTVTPAAWAPNEQYRAAVAELEAAFRNGQGTLQPETLRALQTSLATIDRAMADAERALAADPANDYAAHWLDAIRQRRLRALRQAVEEIRATT